VVDGLDLKVDKGEVLAIVGESGSGKSVTMMALMGLIEHPGIVTADALSFDGKDMLKLSNRQRRQIVGKDLAMVFQDPMTALNPSYTVGFQIEEVLRLHLKMSGKQARTRHRTAGKGRDPGRRQPHGRLPAPTVRRHEPARGDRHGDCRRAEAADRRRTDHRAGRDHPGADHGPAAGLQKEQNMGLLITHDLAVVAETAQRVCVMYAGQAVEVGQVPQLFDIPAHPTAKRCSRRSRAQPGRRAPGDPARHRARPLRPPAGLPAVAALPVRAGQLPPARPALDPKANSLVRCFYPLNQEVA
jgi:dipeptide transport system ATP-binding protein